MAKKIKKPFKPLVQVSRRRDLFLRVVIYLLLVTLAVVLAFYVGQLSSREALSKAQAEVSVLSAESERNHRQITSLNEELAVLRVAREVSDNSTERSKTDLARLQDEVAELSSLVSYYRSLMDSSANTGVSVGNVDIRPTLSGGWALSAMVQQVSNQHDRMQGELSAAVIVERANGEIGLIEIGVQRLNFRYFQRYVTEVYFDEGVVAKQLELKLKVNGHREETTTFDWPVVSGE